VIPTAGMCHGDALRESIRRTPPPLQRSETSVTERTPPPPISDSPAGSTAHPASQIVYVEKKRGGALKWLAIISVSVLVPCRRK